MFLLYKNNSSCTLNHSNVGPSFQNSAVELSFFFTVMEPFHFEYILVIKGSSKIPDNM